MEDLTDNEREEQLRRWWSDNWAWMLGGIALGIGLLWGFNYWKSAKLAEAQQDEFTYESVISLLTDDKFDDAVAAAKGLRDRHPKSPYTDQADLAVARAAVESRRFEDGAGHLRVVMDSSRDAELRSIARTRLARVYIEQGKFDDALALLPTADAGAWAALYHDVRGDAYAGKGDPAAARSEYDAALAVPTQDSGLDRTFVELKRDALPAAAAPAASAAPAAPATVAPAAPAAPPATSPGAP